MSQRHVTDVETILARRHDNGGDFWASDDGKIYVGNPFSTIGCLLILHELRLEAGHEAIDGALALLLEHAREDGQIRLGPKTPLYPCYTAEAVRALCRFGLHDSPEAGLSISFFLDSAEPGGGWRCNFTRFGRGPETEHANPGATLYILDILRYFAEFRAGHPVVDNAVAHLLGHWDTKTPLGPCHWGIGSTFMQVEFPFLRYSLFYYVYILSHFASARGDARFQAAFDALTESLDSGGQIIVERPHRRLARLEFCRKGQPSCAATRRYREIMANIGG